MDIGSDTFGMEMPQKILQKLSLDAVDYAIDYPFPSMASNNSSTDFAQVMMKFPSRICIFS